MYFYSISLPPHVCNATHDVAAASCARTRRCELRSHASATASGARMFTQIEEDADDKEAGEDNEEDEQQERRIIQHNNNMSGCACGRHADGPAAGGLGGRRAADGYGGPVRRLANAKA